MRLLLLVSCMICARAQSGIEVPAVGVIVDPSGALRPVQGVAGNFLLGPATVLEVVSAACSERLCLTKTDSNVISTTGRTDAPPGPAIFSLNGGEAMVYFPNSRTFARWHDDTLDSLDWAVNGEVLSIRLRDGEVEVAARRDGNVWIVRPDGSVVDWVTGTAGPVMLLAGGVVFATPDEVVLRRADASEIRLTLAGAETITAMGPRYAAIRAGDSNYALRTESGQESLFLLPGNGQ